MPASDLSTPVVASTSPREKRITTLGLEKNNETLRTFRTFAGNWFTICMRLCNMTLHFQVIDFSSEGNFFNFFF